MKTGISEALTLTLVMGAVIFLCRVLPFLLFRSPPSKREGGWAVFFTFVERIVPPAAMTVLTFNAVTGPIKENSWEAIPVLSAALFTALVHLWKRNPLLSIVGGTALYMILERIGGQ